MGLILNRSGLNLGAERVSQVNGKSNGHANTVPEDGEWAYDGDAERPDAWHSDANGHGDQMRWSKKPKSQQNPKRPSPPSAPRRTSSKGKSPFALGEDDEESIPSGSVSPSSRPLPSDAIDLVVDDPDKVEEARIRGRQRGEPQKQAPAHVYIHKDPETGSRESVEEVYQDSGDVTGQVPISESMEKDEMPAAELVMRLERVDERGVGDDVTPVRTPYEVDNPWA